MSLFTMLFPTLLKCVGWFLGKSNAKKEAHDNFIALVESLEFGGMKSVSLNESYRAQIEARKKKRQDEKSSSQ